MFLPERNAFRGGDIRNPGTARQGRCETIGMFLAERNAFRGGDTRNDKWKIENLDIIW
jgi:hypothetical protein